jgi:hypothetical protein
MTPNKKGKVAAVKGQDWPPITRIPYVLTNSWYPYVNLLVIKCVGEWATGHEIDKTRHGKVHVGMRTLDGLANRFESLGNNPAFTTEHARDVSLEHVEGMVNLSRRTIQVQRSVCLANNWQDGSECPDSSKGQCESQQVPAHSQSTSCRQMIVHIGKGVAVSGKCVTDLLEL